MLPVLAVALALSVAVNGTVVFLFLRYLAERDQLDADDRQQWANRVQAPDVAVAATTAREPTPREELYPAWDDDLDFHGIKVTD